MNSKATRTVEQTIAKQHIVSMLEEYLRRYKLVLDNEDVTTIQFGDLNADMIPLKIFIKEEQKGAPLASQLQKETP